MVRTLKGIVIVAPKDDVAIGKDGGQSRVVGDLKLGQQVGVITQVVTAEIENSPRIVDLQPIVEFKELIHLVVVVGGNNLVDEQSLRAGIGR